MPPLVSCVCLTTAPKRAAYLPDAVRAFRWQTYPDRELVIVNDGEPLTSSDPMIRVVNLPAIGRRWTLGEKRNVGVREARGDYLATWDDDDVSMPERLAHQVAEMERTRADAALADAMAVADDALRLVGVCHRGTSRPVQASAMLRRSAVVAAGGYPVADYREDAELLERLRLYVRAHVITLPGCEWYIMRRHRQNVTHEFGETSDEYIACGLRAPEVAALQRRLDALRAVTSGEL